MLGALAGLISPGNPFLLAREILELLGVSPSKIRKCHSWTQGQPFDHAPLKFFVGGDHGQRDDIVLFPVKKCRKKLGSLLPWKCTIAGQRFVAAAYQLQKFVADEDAGNVRPSVDLCIVMDRKRLGANATIDIPEFVCEISGVVALFVAAIMGPVAVAFLTRSLPVLTWLTLHWQPLFFLLASLKLVGLLFVALIQRLSASPATNISYEVPSLNINTSSTNHQRIRSHDAEKMGGKNSKPALRTNQSGDRFFNTHRQF